MKKTPTRRRGSADGPKPATGPKRAGGAKPAPALARLRALCRALDEVTETPAWGHPNFRVCGKTFAAWEIVRGRPSIAVKLDADLQELLIDDVRVFRTPYGDRGGWVSFWVDGRPDWRMLGRLVRRAHALATDRTRPARKTRA